MHSAVDAQLVCRLWVDASRALHRLGGFRDAVDLAGDAQSVCRLRLGADYAELSPRRVGGLDRAVYVAVGVEGI